jgi:hypothetical protein
MTTNTDDLTPLPCPFCGHVGLDFKEGTTFRWLAYSCAGCGTGNETRVQTLGEGTMDGWRERGERDAVEQWNTRARQHQGAIMADYTKPALPHGKVWVNYATHGPEGAFTAEQMQSYTDACVAAAIAAAAPAQPADPVAWGLFAKVEGGEWALQHPVRFTEQDARADMTMYERCTQLDVRALYVAPPSTQPLTLSDEQIERVCEEFDVDLEAWKPFARAILSAAQGEKP